MSPDAADKREGEPVDAASLLARAGNADMRLRSLRVASAHDLLIPDAARLDDRRRFAARRLLNRTIAAIVDEIGMQAGIDIPDKTDVISIVEARLNEDIALVGDVIDRVTLDLIGEALPEGLVDDVSPPDLLSAAPLYPFLKIAEAGRSDSVGLPAEHQVRLCWWSAAAIAQSAPRVSERDLADATGRVLAGYDEGERLEAVAVRLAGLLDARDDTLAALIDHCIGGRQIVFLVALLATGLKAEYDTVRAMFVEPDDTRLWVALRALSLPREAIARVGFALCEADRRCDVEAFADHLDPIMSIDPAQAGEALAPLRLPRDYRLAFAPGDRT